MRTVKNKLEEKYGENIIIAPGNVGSEKPKNRKTGEMIISDAWYENRMGNEEDERIRGLWKCIAIIREDTRIWSQVPKYCHDI